MSQLLYNPIASGSIAASPNGAVRASNVVTIQTTVAHGLTSEHVGMAATLQGITDTSFIGSFPIASVPDTTHFTFAQTGANATSGSGTWKLSPAQFYDQADSELAGGAALTDVILKRLSHNAHFAAVRHEAFFMGYFRDGDTVPVPQSLVDDYIYTYAECLMVPMLASSRQPDGTFVVAQKTFPALNASDAGSGSLVVVPYKLNVNKSTGVVQCRIYFGTSGDTGQGTVAVWCLAQRSSVN